MFLGENSCLSLLKHSEGTYIQFENMVKDSHLTNNRFPVGTSGVPLLACLQPSLMRDGLPQAVLFPSHQGLGLRTACTHQVYVLLCRSRNYPDLRYLHEQGPVQLTENKQRQESFSNTRRELKLGEMWGSCSHRSPRWWGNIID